MNPSAFSGPAQASWSANASDNSAGYAFAGQASAKANYGVFGAASSASISAPFYTGGGLGNAAAAYGVMNDTITINSAGHAARSSGFLELTFSVDGTLDAGTNSAAPSGANALIGVRLGTLFDAPFNATVFGGQQGTLTRHAPGFTTGIGTVSGASTVATGPMEFFFGLPTELQLGLLAQVRPVTMGGAPGHSDANFMLTAKVSGLEVLDAAGNVISEFAIDAQSGASYSMNGIVSAPEANSLWLVVVGLAMLSVFACRRANHRSSLESYS